MNINLKSVLYELDRVVEPTNEIKFRLDESCVEVRERWEARNRIFYKEKIIVASSYTHTESGEAAIEKSREALLSLILRHGIMSIVNSPLSQTV